MIETLYNTGNPDKEKSERYILVLTPKPASKGRRYSFMEKHGYWDDDQKRLHFDVTSIRTEEQMTYEDGLEAYNSARRRLAEKGFIHSFIPDFLRTKPHVYQVIDSHALIA